MDINLERTIDYMKSDKYEDRFLAEVYQLNARIQKLEAMLEKYKKGELTFTPKCSYDLLNGQLKAMKLYKSYLDERSIIEDIPISYAAE